ncbi:hypothetical protein Tco_1048419 [Tanacetum coccineum]
MDFRSFMLEGVDGEFNFLLVEGVSEGQNSPSAKFVNNDAPVIGANPLSFVYPSNIVENVADSDDPSYEEVEKTLVSIPRKALPLKVQKVPARASKVAGDASTPLDIDSDSDIHGVKGCDRLPLDFSHVTPPSWKQHLMDISIEKIYDIHDIAYMRQAVLDNVLNSRTQELISALYKAKTSYDTIRAQEHDKDRAYAELERKCNKALQDLEKNPLAKIEDIKSERERLKSSEIQLLPEIDSLKQDRAAVVSKVIPDAAMKLVRSDDLGVLISKLVRSSIIYGRCQAFEEVAAMKEPFVLEKMSGYRPSSKEEYDQAGDALANSSYPFLVEYVVNPYASLEQLLLKKPPSL